MVSKFKMIPRAPRAKLTYPVVECFLAPIYSSAFRLQSGRTAMFSPSLQSRSEVLLQQVVAKLARDVEKSSGI